MVLERLYHVIVVKEEFNTIKLGYSFVNTRPRNPGGSYTKAGEIINKA
jgi:hypothetical protein